jgi:hypothetical protein
MDNKEKRSAANSEAPRGFSTNVRDNSWEWSSHRVPTIRVANSTSDRLQDAIAFLFFGFR